MVPHAGVVNLLVGCASRQYPLGTTRYCVSSNYVFDPFVFGVSLCIGVLGGTCVLLRDSAALLAVDVATNVTCLDDVPSVLVAATIPLSVRWIEVGGEALTEAVIGRVNEAVRLYNGYGPTEVSVECVGKEVVRPVASNRLASIGRPLPNVTCYVVDVAADAEGGVPSPQLQPIGVWGELWLGGVQVARGYLNQPDLTASKFIANPWAETDPSGRGVVYRTGDRVRWYADGELEFGGRLDFQVKLRGQRIELGEIEAALSSLPGVDQAVVVLDARLDALVAYVSPAEVVGASDDAGYTAASAFSGVESLVGAASSLPSYMVPSWVIGVAEWPRTSSAKIDRKRLPHVKQGSVEVSVTVAPRSAAEAMVREAFASVLGLEASTISVKVSFFELGGNSLKAVLLARRLTEVCDRTVSAADVTSHATVAGLAADNDSAPILPPLVPSISLARCYMYTRADSFISSNRLVSGCNLADLGDDESFQKRLKAVSSLPLPCCPRPGCTYNIVLGSAHHAELASFFQDRCTLHSFDSTDAVCSKLGALSIIVRNRDTICAAANARTFSMGDHLVLYITLFGSRSFESEPCECNHEGNSNGTFLIDALCFMIEALSPTGKLSLQ